MSRGPGSCGSARTWSARTAPDRDRHQPAIHRGPAAVSRHLLVAAGVIVAVLALASAGVVVLLRDRLGGPAAAVPFGARAIAVDPSASPAAPGPVARPPEAGLLARPTPPAHCGRPGPGRAARGRRGQPPAQPGALPGRLRRVPGHGGQAVPGLRAGREWPAADGRARRPDYAAAVWVPPAPADRVRDHRDAVQRHAWHGEHS